MPLVQSRSAPCLSRRHSRLRTGGLSSSASRASCALLSSRNQLPSSFDRPGWPSFRMMNRLSLSRLPNVVKSRGSRSLMLSRPSHRSKSPLRLGLRSGSSGPKARRGRPLFQSSLSLRRLVKVPSFPSRLSRSPDSRSLKNLSRKLKRSFLDSSESCILDGRSVASIEPLPAMRDAEAKAVRGGPRIMSSVRIVPVSQRFF